jgi:hypothetical protein
LFINSEFILRKHFDNSQIWKRITVKPDNNVIFLNPNEPYLHRLVSYLNAQVTDLSSQISIKKDIENVNNFRIPLFHHSLNDSFLPDAFHSSAKALKEKYPGSNRIEI